MKKIIMVLVVSVLAGNADAASLTLTRKTVDNGWEKATMHCDQFGRCWKERHRNALLESYNYAPPPRVGQGVTASKPPGSVQIGASAW